jgi:transcriptional regulator GlxA family with amidase domain
MQELEYLDPDHASFLHQAAQAGVSLVGVCTGAFVLHRAGLLQGYRCCVSWFHHNDFLEQFEGITPVSDQIFVVDRDRLTCSGGTSSAHLAAFLVDRHIGRAASKKSLAIMMIDEAMAAERPQPGLPLELSTSDPLVRKALLTIQQRLETPLSVAALADHLKTSRRKLERHFAEALNMTPSRAGTAIRIAHAELLLSRSALTVTQVAQDCGFVDVSHLIRVFKSLRGTTPEVWRDRAPARGVAGLEGRRHFGLGPA